MFIYYITLYYNHLIIQFLVNMCDVCVGIGN